MPSRFELNIFAQPDLVRALLNSPAPSWLHPPKNRTTYFVGVGSNFHAAKIAEWLWCRAGLKARAVHSFDFVTRPYRLAKTDLGVFLSHRGGKSYTVQAEARTRRSGTRTIIVTAAASSWKTPAARLETGPLENTGAFTHSLTTTLAWLLRWTGKPALLSPFRTLDASLRFGPDFPVLQSKTDVVLIGDGPREWVAREIALKLQETASLRARAFGLEEFLHGPILSVDSGSQVIGFAHPKEKRWAIIPRSVQKVSAAWTCVLTRDWLAQILWGQRLALHVCNSLGIDPDLLRGDAAP